MECKCVLFRIKEKDGNNHTIMVILKGNFIPSMG